MAVQLYPHQEKAVSELSNGKILRGGVGSGKSLTAAAYYMLKEAPKDVYVITTAKKRDSLDWEKEFVQYGVGTRSDATTAGTLTVDSWNNLGRFRNVEGAFFIFDEQRLVGSGSWSKIFIRIARRNKWILLTATPGDTWLDYVSVFVANGFYKNRTEFKRDHVIYNAFTKFPKVDRYVGVGKLIRLRKRITVEMPFSKHTIRKTKTIEVSYDAELFRKVVKERWHVYENRPLRTASELFSVMRKVVNSDPSRTQAVRDLLSQHSKLIVFYNFDYELYMLRALLEAVGSDATSAQSSSLEARNGGESTPPFESTSTGLTRSSPKTLDTRPSKQDTEAIKSIGTSTPTGLWMKQGESFTSEPSSDVQLVEDLGQTKILTTTSPILVAPAVAASMEIAKWNGPKSDSLCVTQNSQNFAMAEWNGHNHQPIPKTERWLYLVQYQAGGEAWETIETDAMVFFSLPYSYKIFEQAHGRNDRLNTPFSILYYYELMSDAIIDQLVHKALVNKKNFNESQYYGQLGR